MMQKKYFIYFLSFFYSFCFSQIDAKVNTPRELTLQFIQDYKQWNDFAFKNGDNTSLIEEKYREKIIYKYCLPSKSFQNIAFGSESSHCPLKEKIIAENTRTNVSVVNTRYKDHKLGIEDRYEYHYIKVDGKWYLNEVYYVDGEGKYEGL